MNKKLLLFILFSTLAHSQSTTVTATVTDGDSNAWANGTYQIQFLPAPQNPNPNAYVWTGGVLTQSFSGSLNSSGALSVSIPSNSAITPTGSQWTFRVCPNATSGCFSLPMSITGASQSITTQLSAAAGQPRFSVIFLGWGYGTVEVTPTPNPGVIFYNVSSSASPTCNQWTGSAWAACGGSGTFNALTGDATSTSTGGATEVVGLLNHLLPSLSTGYLNWTGSGWALSSVASSTSITSSTGDLTVSPSPLTGTGTIDLNLGNANTWTATQTFPSASITNAELAHSTISGISLGSNLDTLTISSPLTGTSYNGSAAASIGLGTLAAGSNGLTTFATIAVGTLTNGDFCTYSSTGPTFACNSSSSTSISFPQTVSGTTTSGGIPYFSNTTTLTSSGILNSNILVKGGGAGTAPTNSSVTDNGTTVSTTEPISSSGAITSGGTTAGVTPGTGGVDALVSGTNPSAVTGSSTLGILTSNSSYGGFEQYLAATSSSLGTAYGVPALPLTFAANDVVALGGTANSPVLQDAGYAYNAIPLSDLATQSANTVLANVTASTAHPTAAAIPSGIQNYVAGTGYNQATAHQIQVPQQCADSSGSPTAQSCTTSPSFTPASPDCMIYTTTTANTGTALTINWNSLGAKSVAKWGSGAYTTTLAANDVLANKPLEMCYDGTNIDIIAGLGNAPSGGGGTSISYFTLPGGNNSGSGYSIGGSLANQLSLQCLSVTGSYSGIGHLVVSVGTADTNAPSTNLYSAGIYNCITGAAVCTPSAAVHVTATGNLSFACQQGSSLTISPGVYGIALAGSYHGTGQAAIAAVPGTLDLYTSQDYATVTGGLVPASITAPTITTSTPNFTDYVPVFTLQP